MPELTKDKNAPMAFLEHQDKSLGAKFFITQIDGKSRGIGWIDKFELLPGKRAVTASIDSYGYNGEPMTRYFTAEAGKKYLLVVTDNLQTQTWTFSIIDRTTGRAVDSSY